MEARTVYPTPDNTVDYESLPDDALLPAIDPSKDGGRKGRYYRKSSVASADQFSDSEIGDKAFRNPPSDLDGDERESVRDAIGASDQRLDDNEIGDSAFRNVPTDLSPSEQESVREAIGAGHDSQSLSDSEIGDKAFSNPPSDLNDNEKETARNAIGASDQDLTDTKIGEMAFDNVPSDLTSGEKKVVREAIGAGVPLPSTTGKVGRVLSVGSNRVAFWDLALDVILRALGDVTGKGGYAIGLTQDESALQLLEPVGDLSDTEIGDKAFSNPPIDLSDAEKLAVRKAIGIVLSNLLVHSDLDNLNAVTKDLQRGSHVTDPQINTNLANGGVGFDDGQTFDPAIVQFALSVDKPNGGWNLNRVIARLAPNQDRSDWVMHFVSNDGHFVTHPGGSWVEIESNQNFSYWTVFSGDLGDDIVRLELWTRDFPTTFLGAIGNEVVSETALSQHLARHIFTSIKQLQDVTKDILRGKLVEDYLVVNDPAELGLAIDSINNPEGNYDEALNPPVGKLEKLRPEVYWPGGSHARVVIKLLKSEDRNDWVIRNTPYDPSTEQIIDIPGSLWLPIEADNGDNRYNYFSLNYYRDYGSGIGRRITRIEGATRSLPTTWAGQIAEGIIHDTHLDTTLRGKVGKIPDQPARFVQKFHERLAPNAAGVRVGTSENFVIDENKLYQIAFLETAPQVSGRNYLGSFNQIMSGNVVASLGSKDVGLQHFDRRDSSLGISLFTNGDNHLLIGQQGSSGNPLGDHDVYVFEWE